MYFELVCFYYFQEASRKNNKSEYKKYVEAAKKSIEECTLRGQLSFLKSDNPINISEVNFTI